MRRFALIAIIFFALPALAQGPKSSYSVQLNWTASTSSGIASQNVYFASSGCPGTPAYTLLTSLSGTATTFTDPTARTVGSDYCYAITAVNANGIESAPAAVTANLIPPNPPTGVTAVAH